MSSEFNVIVIGSGPAGYVALSDVLSLVSVPQSLRNVGENLSLAERHLSECRLYSVQGTIGQFSSLCRSRRALVSMVLKWQVSPDIPGMMARKDKIVSQLTGGVSGLLKANGVTVITGVAVLNAGRRVEVTSADGQANTYIAEHVVLAAGSEPAAILRRP